MQDSRCGKCIRFSPGVGNFSARASSNRPTSWEDESCVRSDILQRTCKRAPSGQGFCWYHIEYVSGFFTDGVLARDDLQLQTSSMQGQYAKIPEFQFGLALISSDKGLANREVSGLLGLSRSPFSLVSQPASKQLISRTFGYCLPKSIDSALGKKGSLILGLPALLMKPHFQFTTLSKNPRSSGHSYYVNIINIYVNGSPLPIPTSAFQFKGDGSGGTTIDSGFTYSWLVPEAFDPLFKAHADILGGQLWSPPRPAFPICVGEKRDDLPSVKYEFEGEAKWFLSNENNWGWVLFKDGARGYCLLIRKNTSNSPKNYFGNKQQRDFWVIYDDERSRLGFEPSSCGAS